MSLEAWGDDGLDDNMAERASEAGYLLPEDVDKLRDLLKWVDAPTEFSRGAAAMILIEHILDPVIVQEGSDLAVRLAWARTKLPQD